jgi:hypothetical protein
MDVIEPRAEAWDGSFAMSDHETQRALHKVASANIANDAAADAVPAPCAALAIDGLAASKAFVPAPLAPATHSAAK